MLPISEIFYSIQGEGLHAGRPSVFIRLYYCNLYCSWCDSKYTWENQAKAKEGIDYFLVDDSSLFKIISNYKSKNIVITGGEPLIHQSYLINTLKSLKERGYRIEIETNGTVMPKEELIQLVDLFTVSPKLSNSNVKYEHRIKPAVLSFFSSLENSVFKFVIVSNEDIEEVLSLIKEFKISNEKVMLMPEGTDLETLVKRSIWLVEICKEHNFRYSPRIHIMLWGNKRGF
ncbi:MAG TPA: 7-carboxy-7-deazaguanine synthase QueE [Geobacterales bacterium]|nr:7-carboxy-7-deazaguanine synthase QueE [Geobacterales bacterium]